MHASNLRVGLCYNFRRDFPRQADHPEDIDADWDVPETVDRVLSGLGEAGYEAIDLGDPLRVVDADVRCSIDLVFSICEMQGYRFREGLVPSLCQLLSVPYVMSPPDTLMISLDKNLCNLVVRQAGAPVPDWWLGGSSAIPLDVKQFDSFPYIVKPSAEGSGMGISSASVVSDRHELEMRVESVVSRYRQPALIQTFLPGREFTIGLIERGDALVPLEPLEIVPVKPVSVFIYGGYAKENADAVVRFVPLKGEPALADKLRDIAQMAFTAIGCRDAARVDLRLSEDGTPHFVEINPLPHLHPQIGDFCRSALASGYTYAGLLRALVDNSARRWGFK